MKAGRATGFRVSLVATTLLVLGVIDHATAAPTATQRRQLIAARRSITRASGLIRRKKFKDAEKLLGEAEAEYGHMFGPVWTEVCTRQRWRSTRSTPTGVKHSSANH